MYLEARSRQEKSTIVSDIVDSVRAASTESSSIGGGFVRKVSKEEPSYRCDALLWRRPASLCRLTSLYHGYCYFPPPLPSQDLLTRQWYRVDDKVAREKAGQALRDAFKTRRASAKRRTLRDSSNDDEKSQSQNRK